MAQRTVAASGSTKRKLLSLNHFRNRLRVIRNSTMDFRERKATKNPKVHRIEELRSWGNTDYYNTLSDYRNQYNPYENIARDIKNGKDKYKDVIIKKKTKLNNKINEEEDDISCFTRSGWKINVKQFLMKTTLHGMRYIGDGRLSFMERIFWFISVFLAMVVAAYFIGNIYEKWNTAPMIVSLNPEPAQLTTIPFPAVTICNMNLVKKSVADRILNEGNTVDKKLLEGFCSMNNDSAILDIDSIKAGEWSYFKRFLIDAAQPCNQLLSACRWKNEPKSCETLFNAALTDEGLCCTFNSVHREMMFRNPRDLSDLNITFPFPAVDWTPENGYPSNAPLDGFPWRPIGAGAHLGLTLVLDAAVQEYYCSSTRSVGFKILLHNPSETPKITDFGDLLPPGEEIRLVVRPRIYDAQPQLRNIAMKKRRCYFSNERKLVYYRTYTQKNCAMECEARLTIEKCNCSQYFMPKNSSVRICGITDAKCYVELKVAIEDKLGVNESAILLNTNCDDCFPACYELSYGKEMSTAFLTDTLNIQEDFLNGKTTDYFVKNMAIVHVYFVDTSFIRYTKGELFGFTDFLSNTGGLLGLFMGFSFLSFVEIVYFLTLRIICAFYRNNASVIGTVYPFSE